VLTGLAEIGGGWLVWQWLRETRPWPLGLLGALLLIAYGVILTFSDRPTVQLRTCRRRGGAIHHAHAGTPGYGGPKHDRTPIVRHGLRGVRRLAGMVVRAVVQTKQHRPELAHGASRRRLSGPHGPLPEQLGEFHRRRHRITASGAGRWVDYPVLARPARAVGAHPPKLVCTGCNS
jgi:hypothetical protein